MDIERIVMKVMVDSTNYFSQWDKIALKVHEATSKIERMGLKLKLPEEQIRKQVHNIIGEFQRLQAAADQLNFHKVTKGILAESGLAGFMMGRGQIASINRMIGHVWPNAGGPLDPGSVGASQQQLAIMRSALGIRDTTGATPEQLAALQQIRRMGALPALGPTRTATPAEMAFLRASQGVPFLPPPFASPLAPQYRPSAMGMHGQGGIELAMQQRQDRVQRELARQARLDAAEQERRDRETARTGLQWQWIPSILGGAVGRVMGGRLGGLGGMIGGGLGGPFGAVAGVAGGTALHAGFELAEAAARGVLNVVESIGRATIWAASHAVTLGMEYERTLTMFQVMTGSKTEGADLFKRIQTLGVETPFTTRQLGARASTLLGYGIDSDQIVPVLSRLGDIASGDNERLMRLVLAYGQVMSHGRLMGQEVRQFAEAGVGLADFARTAGMSPADLRELMRTGGAGSDIMIQTINRLTNPGGRFFGSSAEQMKTVGGAWSNLVERLELGAGRLGVAFFERFNVARMIQEIADALAGLEKYTGPFLDWMERGATAMSPFMDMLASMRDTGGNFLQNVFGEPATWESLSSTFDDLAVRGSTAFIQISEGIEVAIAKIETFLVLADRTVGLMTGQSKEGRTASWYAEKAMQGMDVAIWMNPAVASTKELLEAGWEALGWASPKVAEIESRAPAADRAYQQILSNRIKRRFNQGLRLSGLSTNLNDPLLPALDGGREFFGGAGFTMMRMGLMAAGVPFWATGGTANIRGPKMRQMDPELSHWMDRFSDHYKEGATPFDKMMNQSRMINRAFPRFDGMGGIWGFNNVAFEPMRQAGFMQIYRDAERAVGDRFETRLSSPMARGSAEAQDVINRAMTDQVDVQQRALQVLEEMKKIDQEQKEEIKRIVPLVEEWLRRQGMEQGPMPREIANG